MRRPGAIAACLVAAVALAADAVPPKVGLLVMLKVLTYDATFASRGSGDFVVLVPYEAGAPEPAAELVREAEGLEVKAIKDRPLRFAPLLASQLEARLSSGRAAAVLLHRGYPVPAAREALAAARARRAYTMALDDALVKEGAVLGVGLLGGKPQPLINVTAARGINAEFGAAVLRLAKTYQ